MKLVIIESPFASNHNHTEADHRTYLERCIRDCIERGESPYASHKMLTDCLDDTNAEERELGINAGLPWKHVPGIVSVFYVDYGWSQGMREAMKYMHENAPMTYEIRRIGRNPENNG